MYLRRQCVIEDTLIFITGYEYGHQDPYLFQPNSLRRQDFDFPMPGRLRNESIHAKKDTFIEYRRNHLSADGQIYNPYAGIGPLFRNDCGQRYPEHRRFPPRSPTDP